MNKSKKIAVFCTNHHHLEKALFLRKHFNTRVHIFNEAFNLIEKGNRPIKNRISKIIENNDAFIFFTLLPNKWTLRLVKKIRNSRKTLIAFQESHQLSMHDNEVNNIIFKPDVVVAASFDEKEKLKLISPCKSSEIISYGWIFSSIEPKLLIDKRPKTKELKKSLLLVLSAPSALTFSSHESNSIRKNLIKSLTDIHPNYKLNIKPHPNEKITDLHILINSLGLQNRKIEIIRSIDGYLEAINDASLIFVSNRTQALFDLIDTNKVHLYLLGNENFISKHALKFCNTVNRNGIDFIQLTDSECIKQFNSKYINKNIEDIKKIEAFVVNKDFSDKYDHKSEISLWEMVLTKVSLKKLKAINLGLKLSNQEIEKNDQSFEELINRVFAEETLSIKTSLFIIITRIGLQGDLWKNERFIKLLNENFNEWFIQYFILDAISISYHCKNKDSPLRVSKRSFELLDQAIINTSSKSKLFLLLIKVLDYSVNGELGMLKNSMFKLAIKGIGIIRYLSNS